MSLIIFVSFWPAGAIGAGDGATSRTGGSSASSRLTDELKGLSLDELRGQSERYKARARRDLRAPVPHGGRPRALRREKHAPVIFAPMARAVGGPAHRRRL